MSWLNKLLNNNPIQLRLKQGDKADINTTLTKGRAITGEPHYASDTDQLFIYNGTENILANRATYCDYALTATGSLPTTLTKMDFSGATLVSETEDMFDATNSRITFTDLNAVGQATISFTVDTAVGTAHWVDLQLRAYDDTNTLLFVKRSSTVSFTKNNTTAELHEILDFYFSGDVNYFEIWWEASSAMTYTDPAITVVRL